MGSIGRSGLAFHQNHQEEAIGVAVVIDDLRNKALSIANGVYSHFGRTLFPYIETPAHYRTLASKIKAVTDILEIKPGIFGFSIDVGKLIERLFENR